MKCDKRHMLLYAVTDRAWTGKQTLYEQVEAALKGGVTCVQLREKELDETAFLQEAKELCALCRRYGVPFLVNDNVEIAIACGADGIHVGQEDLAVGEVRRRVGENMILGVSVHTVEEAREAVRLHAAWLARYWPAGAVTAQAHVGMAEMYVQDERFTDYYEAVAPGAAGFLAEAVRAYYKA